MFGEETEREWRVWVRGEESEEEVGGVRGKESEEEVGGVRGEKTGRGKQDTNVLQENYSFYCMPCNGIP